MLRRAPGRSNAVRWPRCRASPDEKWLDDLAVAALAEGDDRVLLTHDTDFGRVAVHRRRPRSGIVLVRAAVTDLDHVVERLLRLIRASGNELAGRITVLSDRGIRSRSIV